MKIGLIADLHVDRHNELTPNDYAEVLGQSVRQREVDLLIIAGDIANRDDIVVDFIHRLEQLTDITVRFVPGNHDWFCCKVKIICTSIQNYKSKYCFNSKEFC